jgi:hypothetical protein
MIVIPQDLQQRKILFAEKQSDGTSKKLPITVAPALSCKGPSFITKRKECRLGIVAL